MMVRRLQAQRDNHDDLLGASCALFDTVYAALRLAK